MKLISVLGIEEYREELGEIFRKREIPVFSEIEIKGYRSIGRELEDNSNWFAGKSSPEYAILFFAFLSEGEATSVFQEISRLNEEKKLARPVRAFQLHVEKGI